VPRDLTEPSRFKNPPARIRSFQILIPQFVYGDFFDNIGHELKGSWRAYRVRFAPLADE
jgi:hypothetical protein